jgi:hypothetical protein
MTMADPERPPEPHPIPRHRLVVLTALDQRYSKVPLEALLKARGIDPTLPYTSAVDQPSGDTVYAQEIPDEVA